MELSLTSLNRNEKIFATLGLAAIIVFLVTFAKIANKPHVVSQFETNEAINYQMERPEEAFAGYSTEGREIDDQFEGLKKAIVKTLNTKTLPAKGAAAKASATTKSTAVKKPAPASTKNKNLVILAAAADAKAALARSESVQSESAPESADNNRIPQRYDYSQDTNSGHPESSVNPDAKNKKSFSQWRAEVYEKKSKEIITAFITAHRAGTVTAAEFQAMAQDLIEQEDAQLKGLGLMALRAQPSMASLSQLAHIQPQLSPELQDYVEKAYLAYLQPQYLGVFNQVFQSKNKKLVLKSLSILGASMQKIKNGDTSAFLNARQRRDADAPQISVDQFRPLLPSLTAISQLQEPDVSPMASQVASLIQSSSRIAGL